VRGRTLERIHTFNQDAPAFPSHTETDPGYCHVTKPEIEPAL
jgi:hypothetical protein